MNKALKQFELSNNNEFDLIKISIASPEKIRSWSFGEVKKPETINYRTFKPEKDGLFCSRIFGPVKDYECLCGKYKRMKHRGIVCEKCGVEVIQSKVRRERMGHIELAAPVAHIWFLKSLPSRISLLLDMPMKDVERVLYFENHIVIEPGLTNLKFKQILSDEEYNKALDDNSADSFSAGIGAAAIRSIFESMDLLEEKEKIKLEFSETKSDIKKKKLIRRLKLVEQFISSGNKPEWMILSSLPVIPPDLRPLVPLDGGRFATSDLNDLYRRVINRNNRLRRLIELKAPDIIVRNEMRMLQESVDALFDNTRRARPITGSNKRPLKSLADMLKGKQGRFRQNLLGKRCDYSGRSVIVVGPELKLHQCGIPKKMALELFKPFIYSKLEIRGLATTIKSAKKMVEKERSEVWDILDEVIREHPILLNRAPTLHRLGIQAFEPVLIEGKAIRLHPLVCTAFNADFDGDQMAVHVPLSVEAQLEARVLMMSTNNILSPANGKPIIVPTQDIVLGLYFLSLDSDKEKGEGMIFSGVSEIKHALDSKCLSMHAKIKARIKTIDKEGFEINKIVETTPGRLLISEVLPKHKDIPFQLINKVLSKKELAGLIDIVYRFCGQKDTVIFADKLMELGFKHACMAGISFGKDDMIVPEAKKGLVDKTRDLIKQYEKQYSDGLITQGEKYNKVIDSWSKCTDNVADKMMSEMSIGKGKNMNSVFMMADSGARGSAAQMKQLAGMRGLMAKPNGEIIETPIISNFKEGLSVLEYFNSTHGARKGLADTALKTANSGYLTRRLVDVAQDLIITKEDCGTSKGIVKKAIIDAGEIIESLYDRIIGRYCADNLISPTDSKSIAKNGDFIDEELANTIIDADIDTVKVRSALTCDLSIGICSICYGRDLARGTKVNIGEAVGVVAAQSIGEPGTQLTMRTFHIGGAAQAGSEQSRLEATIDGTLTIDGGNVIFDKKGTGIVLDRDCRLVIKDDNQRERYRERVPYGANILIKENTKVSRGQKLAEWDPYTRPIITEKQGYVKFLDLSKETLEETTSLDTGMTSQVIREWKGLTSAKNTSMQPRIEIHDDNDKVLKLSNGNKAVYELPVDAVLSVAYVSGGKKKIKVNAGDLLARIPLDSQKSKDITGGLPRVAELFEARKPKDYSFISDIRGRVEFGDDVRSNRKLIVVDIEDSEKSVEYLIPKGKHIMVQEGDVVNKGDLLMDGNPVPHDILRVLGIEELANYLVNEIQDVYRLQGVKINDKHIEVISRQMLQKVEVIDSGDTDLISGEVLDREDVEKANAKTASESKKIATFIPILNGITKASLQTRSFISAASFQETTRVLTEAATAGKKDDLIGLKENVIVGRLIPAGTGRSMSRFKRIASLNEEKIKAEQAKQIEAT
ncbi:MAG: DNA-directed RNA polymerase subunit beta' [Rickettsiales bacterium]|nr:DNA-directed RNA polymerase subunit beta' [Rickettsiales bacterium]OUV82720.1 MAG: DNA-directed RNA polymerase subunit beta' [Rickettsiales bacterium TMED131]